MSDDHAYNEIEAQKLAPISVELPNRDEMYFFLESAENIHPNVSKRLTTCVGQIADNCHACKSRFRKLALLFGDNEKFAFLLESAACNYNISEIIKCREEVKPTLFNVVVLDGEFMKCFPKIEGKTLSGKPFHHIHPTNKELTSESNAARIKSLMTYLNGSFDGRFKKLVNNLSSLRIIEQQHYLLQRPEHWSSVIEWAISFVEKADGCPWEELSTTKKYTLMVFAIMTGRYQNNVHLNMQQASNLVDFIESANSLEALRSLMDARSDPENYQVSRVAELLKKKMVTSKCTVTLVWEGPDDMDIHTRKNGNEEELYYGNKRVGDNTLDFDANASNVEEFPAENLSLNEVGHYPIEINNYNQRSRRDVSCQIIVRKSCAEEVFSCVWPVGRKNGNKIKVCDVIITHEDLEDKPIVLSDAEKKKLAAHEEEWKNLVGDVTSTVATVNDVEELIKVTPKYSAEPLNAQTQFEQLLNSTPKKESNTLYDRVQMNTLSGFIKYIRENPECSVKVCPRNMVPAYVTNITTKTKVINYNLVVNVFHKKNELPQKPRNDEKPTSRFNEHWGLPSNGLIPVYGFAKINEVWFVILANCELPVNSQEWPLGGGMYPTDLNTSVHHHRSKWASFHGMVKPQKPEGGDTMLIGSALIAFDSFKFVLNGHEINVTA